MPTATLHPPSSTWRRAMRRPPAHRAWIGKLEANYSDLLGMSELVESPPSSSPAPHTSPDALLAKLVQEHLNRAAVGATAENPPEADLLEATPEQGSIADLGTNTMLAEAPTAPDPVAELTTTAPADAALSGEPFRAAVPPADLIIPREPFKATEVADPGASVSAAELDALLCADAQSLVDQEGTEPAALPMARTAEPPAGAPAEASTPAAPAPVVQASEAPAPKTPAPAAPAAVAPTAAAPTPAASTPPAATPQSLPAAAPVSDVPLDPAPAAVAPAAAVPSASAPTTSAPTPARRARGPWPVALFHDLLLMVAQVLDMPFTRLSEQAKRLLAFAGLVLLLGGAVLVLLGCLQH